MDLLHIHWKNKDRRTLVTPPPREKKIQTYQNDRKAILFLGVQIPEFYAFYIMSKIDDLWNVNHIFGHLVA